MIESLVPDLWKALRGRFGDKKDAPQKEKNVVQVHEGAEIREKKGERVRGVKRQMPDPRKLKTFRR